MNAPVLIVDDSLTVRMDLAEAFETAGFEARPCSTLAEAREVLAGHRVELVVLDVFLRDDDGLELLREIRRRPAAAQPRVLLLSTEAEVRERIAGLRAAVDEYVGKPYDIAHLIGRARDLVRSHAGGTGALVPDEKKGGREDRDRPGSWPSSASSESRWDAPPPPGPTRIMAVDDSATYLHELADVLRREGYDVLLAQSGEAAIGLLGAQSVDCILLDLLMPGLDGRETCRRIKASPVGRDIPLIILTAVEDRSAMIEGLGTGADDFISKSSDFDVLKARVRAQLRRKQSEDDQRRIRDELLRSELDASEQRAARAVAEAKAALVEQLELKNRELEAFSYSASHDLRAPLRSIDGFSSILLDDHPELSPEARGHVARIRAAAKRMADLVEALLELSRVGRAELVRSGVDLSALARSALDDLRRRDPDRRVEAGIEPDLLAHADPRLLRVLFENLVGNAWKFTSKSADARVQIGRSLQDGTAAFFVRDNGAGFDPGRAQRLFSPFQRLHAESEFSGTGIGLATVRRIVERHGGRVWAEGRPGQGACFFFTIP